MEDLIELLVEAEEQLMNMWRVADDSVADYTLQIEIAANFIKKALQTQDRLDVFRALQKAHDVLEREEGGYPDDEEYDDLVDRLRAALGGLNENVYMKKLKVKKIITEAVLGFLNEGKLNKVDAVNIPSNTDDTEEPVGDIVPSELTEEEKKKMWFDKLKKRVKHK
jgi:hypothetical protein